MAQVIKDSLRYRTKLKAVNHLIQFTNERKKTREKIHLKLLWLKPLRLTCKKILLRQYAQPKIFQNKLLYKVTILQNNFRKICLSWLLKLKRCSPMKQISKNCLILNSHLKPLISKILQKVSKVKRKWAMVIVWNLKKPKNSTGKLVKSQSKSPC